MLLQPQSSDAVSEWREVTVPRFVGKLRRDFVVTLVGRRSQECHFLSVETLQYQLEERESSRLAHKENDLDKLYFGGVFGAGKRAC